MAVRPTYEQPTLTAYGSITALTRSEMVVSICPGPSEKLINATFFYEGEATFYEPHETPADNWTGAVCFYDDNTFKGVSP